MDAANPPMIVTVGDNTYPNGTQSELDNNAMAYYQMPAAARLLLPDARQPRPQRRRQRQLGELGAHQDLRPADQLARARALLLVRGRRRAVRHPRQRQLLQRHPDQLARQPALHQRARKWKFVFYHHTTYSCANGIASLGSDTNIRNTWGPDLRAQPGRPRLPRPRPHLRAHPLHGRLPGQRQRRQRRPGHHLHHDRRRRRDARRRTPRSTAAATRTGSRSSSRRRRTATGCRTPARRARAATAATIATSTRRW